MAIKIFAWTGVVAIIAAVAWAAFFLRSTLPIFRRAMAESADGRGGSSDGRESGLN
jgi:hypothetical protein